METDRTSKARRPSNKPYLPPRSSIAKFSAIESTMHGEDSHMSMPTALEVQSFTGRKTQRNMISKASNLKFNAKPMLPEDAWLHCCMDSHIYRVVRASIVVLDAALALGELQYHSQRVVDMRDTTELLAFKQVATACCAFFWLDLIMALALEFPKFDLVQGRTGWRMFNVITILQETLEMIGAYAAPGTRFTSRFRLTMGLLACFRILRPLLLLPEMHLHKSMTELQIMIRVLANTLQPLMWCTLLCSSVFAVFAVVFAEAAASHLVHAPEVVAESSADAVMAATWGSVSRAMYSLFLASYGGRDWEEFYIALDPLPTKYGFLAFICFTYIALLNTVTAVFVQCAFMSLARDKEFVIQQELQQKKEYMYTLKYIFHQLDEDDSGQLVYSEMVESLKDPKKAAFFRRLGVDTDDLEKLFILMDEDHVGCVDQAQFILGCLRLNGDAKSVDLEILRQDVNFATDHILTLHQRFDELRFSHMSTPWPALRHDKI